MKRLFQITFALAVLFALAFIGCENSGSSGPGEWDPVYTLPAPEFVSATAYGPTGVIRISWAPVEYASGYDVYRKAEAPSGTTYKVITVGANATTANTFFGFTDEIGYANEFAPGVKYTYKVVALSTPATVGTQVITIAPGGQSVDPGKWILLSRGAKESNTVSFGSDLKRAGEQLDPPQNLTVRKGVNYTGATTATAARGEVIFATWDAQWGVTYHVYYYLEGEAFTYPRLAQSVVTPTAAAAGNTETVTGAAVLPNIYGNGNIKVEVVASKYGALVAGAAPYYLSSDPVVETLPNPSDTPAFSLADDAVSVTIKTPTDDTIRITIDKDPEIESYKIYRFIGTGNAGTAAGMIPANSWVFETWREVTDECTRIDLVPSNPGVPVYYDDPFLNDGLYPSNAYVFYAVIGVNAQGHQSTPFFARVQNNPPPPGSLRHAGTYPDQPWLGRRSGRLPRHTCQVAAQRCRQGRNPV